MEEQRERGRNSVQSVDKSMELDAEATSILQKQGVPITDDSFKYTHFTEKLPSAIVAIWGGKSRKELKEF